MKQEMKRIRKSFILYLIGRMVSDTGTTIQMIIMPLYIIDIGGTASTIGLFSFISFLPTLLIYPFAGVIGDRMNRKTIMVVTDFISGITILFLAIIAYLDMINIPLLLGVQVIVVIMNGLFEPATRGMLPMLVDKEEATRSNAIVSSMRSASIMIGPVIGTMLYGSFGINIVFLINGLSFLFSAFSEVMIDYKHKSVESKSGMIGVIQDLLAGIRFIVSNKKIALLCLFYLVNYSMVQPIFSVIFPILFKSNLNFTDGQYGYIQMIVIFGALLGSILIGILPSEKDKLKTSMVWGTVILSTAMIFHVALIFPVTITKLGNDSFLYLILLSGVLFFLSISSTFIVVPIQGEVQMETPIEYMSRVFSMIGLLSRGGIPLGALLYGITVEIMDLHSTMILATLLTITASVIILGLISKVKEVKVL